MKMALRNSNTGKTRRYLVGPSILALSLFGVLGAAHGQTDASVQPAAQGIHVTLSCRKLWQDKQVRAASIAQGKRYAERWCAARVLPDLPLSQAVERITAKVTPVRSPRTAKEKQQERRLAAALRPPIVP